MRLPQASQDSRRSCPFRSLKEAEPTELSERTYPENRNGPDAYGGPKDQARSSSRVVGCAGHRKRSSSFPQSPFLSCCTKFPLFRLSEEMVLQGVVIIFCFLGVFLEAVPGSPHPFDFWLLKIHPWPGWWGFLQTSLELPPCLSSLGCLERRSRGGEEMGGWGPFDGQSTEKARLLCM